MLLDYLLLLLGVIRATTHCHAALVAENLVLRQQLAVLTRPTHSRPRLRLSDRLFWILVRRLWYDWRCYPVVVQPGTVIRWHREAWRLFWRWRSRVPLGRPRLSAEVQALIVTMARENPTWGSERIRGELLKLGIVVCKRTVQRYRRREPARPPSQTWRTFLTNHAQAIWAADLFTIQTLTFRTLYVLLFITHDRRVLVHVKVTAHPTAAWVWQQLIEATPWGRQPKHLIRDRDAVYGGDFSARAKRLGIETVLTPVRAPRANAIAERVIGTLRRESLDHLLSMDEAHLRTVLAEYVAYYNADRPHRTLNLEVPTEVPTPGRSAGSALTGAIQARPVLGGLHHVYGRAA